MFGFDGEDNDIEWRLLWSEARVSLGRFHMIPTTRQWSGLSYLIRDDHVLEREPRLAVCTCLLRLKGAHAKTGNGHKRSLLAVRNPPLSFSLFNILSSSPSPWLRTYLSVSRFIYPFFLSLIIA
jgi:hypothetical protein